MRPTDCGEGVDQIRNMMNKSRPHPNIVDMESWLCRRRIRRFGLIDLIGTIILKRNMDWSSCPGATALREFIRHRFSIRFRSSYSVLTGGIRVIQARDVVFFYPRWKNQFVLIIQKINMILFQIGVGSQCILFEIRKYQRLLVYFFSIYTKSHTLARPLNMSNLCEK